MSFNSRLQQEKAVENDLAKHGFTSPKSDSDLAKTTEYNATVAGATVPARRFMEKLEFRDPGSLTNSQVRNSEADKEYCETTLIPLIEDNGGLQFPIFIDQQGVVIHGHNRLWSWKKILKDNPTALPTHDIPVIVIGDSVLLNNAKNALAGKFTGNSLKFNNLVSKIICNAPPKNNPYNIESAGYHVRQLFQEDRYMGGKNPCGSPFFDPNDEKNKGDIARFDAIMDWLHPKAFKHKGTRTKIRKLSSKAKGVKKTLTFNDVSTEMLNEFGTAGVVAGSPGVRLPMGQWVDPSGNLYTVIGTAGPKEKEKVRSEIVDRFLASTLKGTGDIYLGVYLSAAQLKADVASNAKARAKYLNDRLGPMNTAMAAKGWPVIKKVRFFVQLNDPRDTGLTATWSATQGWVDSNGNKIIYIP